MSALAKSDFKSMQGFEHASVKSDFKSMQEFARKSPQACTIKRQTIGLNEKGKYHGTYVTQGTEERLAALIN